MNQKALHFIFSMKKDQAEHSGFTVASFADSDLTFAVILQQPCKADQYNEPHIGGVACLRPPGEYSPEQRSHSNPGLRDLQQLLPTTPRHASSNFALAAFNPFLGPLRYQEAAWTFYLRCHTCDSQLHTWTWKCSLTTKLLDWTRQSICYSEQAIPTG